MGKPVTTRKDYEVKTVESLTGQTITLARQGLTGGAPPTQVREMPLQGFAISLIPLRVTSLVSRSSINT
jgi:hypothetical protein